MRIEDADTAFYGQPSVRFPPPTSLLRMRRTRMDAAMRARAAVRVHQAAPGSAERARTGAGIPRDPPPGSPQDPPPVTPDWSRDHPPEPTQDLPR